MARGLELHELPDWPAAMNQQTAAAYCGLSVDTFLEVCPVKPIAVTPAKTGRPYLRVRLDEWLMSLGVRRMIRTPARCTQADIARAIRAVAQAGANAVVEVARDGTIRIVPASLSTAPMEKDVEEVEPVDL